MLTYIFRVRHWAVQVAVLCYGGYIGMWVMAVAAPQGEGEGQAGRALGFGDESVTWYTI